MTRRTLLQAGVLAGSGAAGLAAGCDSTPAGSAYSRSVDVVVVGAGLAGLVAARELARKGLTSVVLEARDRVGGRMWRKQVTDDWWVDLGGQWVGPTQSAILALARGLHVEHFDAYLDGNNVVYYEGARSVVPGPVAPAPASGVGLRKISPADVAAAKAAFATLGDLVAKVNTAKPWFTPNAASLDSQTVSQWIQSNTDNAFARFALQNYTLAKTSGDPDQTSMLWLLFYSAADPSDEVPEKWLFYGAAGQVPPKLASQLGDMVVLAQPVYGIDQDSAGVTVSTPGGRYRGRFAIVAIPPYLAGGIIYTPAMPAVRSLFTQRAPMAITFKYLAVYPAAWWRERGLSGAANSQLPAASTADSSPPGGVPGVLAAFVIGSAAAALEMQSAAARRQVVLSNLSTYFGPRAMNPTEFIELNWPAQQWTGGAYSAYTGPGVLVDYKAAATAPVGRIHWAGSETADRWNGFFDGAVTSAQRAVGEVAARF